MTLLNYWVSPELATVATDTRTTLPADQSRREASKMIPLPHFNAVCSGRGNLDFLRAAVAASQTFPPESFDALIELVPRCMEEAGQWLLSVAPQRVERSPYVWPRQEMVVVGFSPREGCIIHRHFVWDVYAARMQSVKRDAWSLSPADDRAELPADLEPTTDAGLLDLARAQVKAAVARYPDGAFGGRLLVAQIVARPGERGSMTIRDVGDLD